MIRLAAPLAALLALSACAEPMTGDPASGASPDGTYRLVNIDGKPIPGQASMTIAGQSVKGEGPCNTYWTTNEAKWPAVRLAPIATTRRQCFVEGGESDFFAALKQTSAARKTQGGLELTGPKHKMLFKAAD